MALFEVIVEESIEATQRRVIHVEAEDEDDAWYKVYSLEEGETISEELIDTGGATGEDCNLVSIEEI